MPHYSHSTRNHLKCFHGKPHGKTTCDHSEKRFISRKTINYEPKNSNLIKKMREPEWNESETGWWIPQIQKIFPFQFLIKFTIFCCFRVRRHWCSDVIGGGSRVGRCDGVPKVNCVLFQSYFTEGRGITCSLLFFPYTLKSELELTEIKMNSFCRKTKSRPNYQ